jgi:hypothetical protein
MHGTWVDDVRLTAFGGKQIRDGQTLTFGTEISKEPGSFADGDCFIRSEERIKWLPPKLEWGLDKYHANHCFVTEVFPPKKFRVKIDMSQWK